MKKLFSIIFLLLVPVSLSAEYLFLADGSIIEGKIITQKVLTVKVKKADGKTVTLNGFDILRIRQQKTWKEKVFVHAGDKLYIANLVEEKGDEYIFRRDITKPEEFSLKKSSITILGAAAATVVRAEKKEKSFEMSWKEIPGAKEYAVYIKPDRGDYHEAGRTAQTVMTVAERLKGNTRYTCVITAFLESGEETGPCPAAEFMSDNYPPLPPQELSCSIMQLGNARSGAALFWNGDADEDGIVERYNIYNYTDGAYIKIGSSIKKNYIVKGVNAAKIYSFAVTSVDDRAAESAYSPIARSRDAVPYRYYVRGAGIYPLASFGNTVSYGYGGYLTAVKNDCFFRGLDIGFSTGFLYFKGKTSVVKTDALPFNIVTAYHYRLWKRFSIEGAITAGVWYYSSLSMDGRQRSNVKPAAAGGAAGSIDITSAVALRIGGEYGAFYSTGAFRQFAGGSIGTSFKLEM